MPLFQRKAEKVIEESKKPDRRTIIVLLGDFQSGHKEGLMPLDIQIEMDVNGEVEMWHPTPTPFQEYIGAVYEKQVKQVIEIADNDDIIVCTGGDLCQGTYFQRYLISSRLSDQVQIAMGNLQPLLRLKNLIAMRMIKGTGYHEFGEGSAAILCANLVKKERPDISVKTYNMGLIETAGIKIDAAHKGANEGKRKYLSGNEARLYLRSIMYNHFEFGLVPPDIVWRNHYHQYLHVPHIEFWGGVEYTSHYILTPSFQGKDEYIIDRLKSYPILHNGMMVIEVMRGKPCIFHPLIEILDLRIQDKIL